jgi:hypothetical protein
VADSVRDVGLLLGVFVGVTAIAEVFGAANMGTAMTFGVLAFAPVLVWVTLRR